MALTLLRVPWPGEPPSFARSPFSAEWRRSDGRNAASGAAQGCPTLSRTASGAFSDAGIDRNDAAGKSATAVRGREARTDRTRRSGSYRYGRVRQRLEALTLLRPLSSP